MAVVNVTADTFAAEVLNSDKTVVVDFNADWCGPCKMMAPVVEAMAEKYAGRLVVGKLNVDENMDSARKYRVRSIPYMALFKGGELVDHLLGAGSEDALTEKIEAVLG